MIETGRSLLDNQRRNRQGLAYDPTPRRGPGASIGAERAARRRRWLGNALGMGTAESESGGRFGALRALCDERPRGVSLSVPLRPGYRRS
jgi:hypothetical protein